MHSVYELTSTCPQIT